jgi:hypothetical protein
MAEQRNQSLARIIFSSNPTQNDPNQFVAHHPLNVTCLAIHVKRLSSSRVAYILDATWFVDSKDYELLAVGGV